MKKYNYICTALLCASLLVYITANGYTALWGLILSGIFAFVRILLYINKPYEMEMWEEEIKDKLTFEEKIDV